MAGTFPRNSEAVQGVLWRAAPTRGVGSSFPDLIDPIHNFNSLHRAPAGHEGARECRVREADREGIIHHASCARWGRGPPISTTICVQPCVHLTESVAESFGRNADPDPDGKPEFGILKGLLDRPHGAT